MTGERYTLDQIEALPTLHQGQYDNLKVETPGRRVWLSRLRVEDGMPYNDQITVETLQDGRWVTVDTYPADPDRETLEACICGEHYDCPDGWHYGLDIPCSCTPDCALNDDGEPTP